MARKELKLKPSIATGLHDREILLYDLFIQRGIAPIGLSKYCGTIPDASRRCLKIWHLDNCARYLFGLITKEEMQSLCVEYRRIDHKYWQDGEWSWYNIDITLLNIYGTRFLECK